MSHFGGKQREYKPFKSKNYEEYKPINTRGKQPDSGFYSISG
jgi:hypothetical protein